ncbi:MAG: MFS transporter [Chloroflexi bacterium]|nr:MAG: MFS transporter [Chloroflexota bacterium]
MPDRDRARLQGGRRGGALREAFRVQPRLPIVLVAIALAHVGVTAGWTFLPLRILELGGGPPQIAASAAVAGATEVAAMILASRLARRVGLRTLFAAATLLQACACVLWMVLASPEAIIASRVISGAAHSGLWIASVHTMRTLLPPSLQGTGQGLFGVTASGAAAITANVIGGMVYGSLGPAALFGVVAAVGAVGAGVGWLALPRRGERAPVETPTARGADHEPAR